MASPAIGTSGVATGAGACGAGAGLAAAKAEASSPSSSSRAIGALTATPWVPAGTRILPIVPSSTASSSIVALSVSISAITVPAETASPSLTSQRARLPSVIVGASAGIRIWIGMISILPFPSAGANRLDRGDDVGDFRQRQFSS
jgi:hypothetical protein